MGGGEGGRAVEWAMDGPESELGRELELFSSRNPWVDKNKTNPQNNNYSAI